MKKTIKTILFLILIFINSFSYSQNNYIGLWKGVDNKNNIGYLNLDSTGYTYFIIKGDTLGGKSFRMNGNEVYMKYEVNYSRPIQTIDFIIRLKSNDRIINKLPGILKLDKNDRLNLCINFKTKERPISFTKNTSIVLERIE